MRYFDFHDVTYLLTDYGIDYDVELGAIEGTLQDHAGTGDEPVKFSIWFDEDDDEGTEQCCVQLSPGSYAEPMYLDELEQILELVHPFVTAQEEYDRRQRYEK